MAKAKAYPENLCTLVLGSVKANLFGLVSTDPKVLLKDFDYAIGERKDFYIKKLVDMSDVQLCGWGSFKPVWLRYEEVYRMLNNPVCLGINADGQPKHPLYISYAEPMVKYVLGD
jgi:hypothetical protein